MIVFDTGALVALDRNDRPMWARLEAAAQAEVPILVPLGVLAQAWRGGPRQALLTRALRYVDRISFDEVAAAAGELCGRAATHDVIDASVALVAARPAVTHLYTSDPDDLGHLLSVLRTRRKIIRC